MDTDTTRADVPANRIAALRLDLDRLMAEESDQELQADAVARLALDAVHVAREHGAIGPKLADEITASLHTILAELTQRAA